MGRGAVLMNQVVGWYLPLSSWIWWSTSLCRVYYYHYCPLFTRKVEQITITIRALTCSENWTRKWSTCQPRCQCYSTWFPFIFFNIPGFSIFQVTTYPLRGYLRCTRFPQKRFVVILTTYLHKTNRSPLRMMQTLAKGKVLQSYQASHITWPLIETISRSMCSPLFSNLFL